MRKSSEVDAYISKFPAPIQGRLFKVRAAIRAAAPGATELISYRIPAYRQNRMLVYFAGFRNHIGLYPPVRGNASLERAAARYAGPKGNLKFPLDESLPLALIARIVRFKVKQDLARMPKPKAKKKK
jgi:uncharacterized protein YdhG (YjbR/CyaY superfamily)